MPPDLAQLLHESAPQPGRELDPAELWTAGRRRRRYRRAAYGVAVIAVVGLTATGINLLDRRDADHVVTAGGEFVTYHDPVHNLTVRYPDKWHRAGISLTPNLGDPGEILSLGTGDLPVGGESCAQFPMRALEAMSRSDALMTIQERGSADTTFPPRPDRFPPTDSYRTSEVVDCLTVPAVFDHWWFGFRDAGRNFYVLVAIGTDASDETRGDTWRILDSLEFESQPQLRRVPALIGLTVEHADKALHAADLRGEPTDGDPTELDAVVVAQEPPEGTGVSPGQTVGLRTAVITPELCEVLRRVPDFANGATWDLPLDVLQDVANLAGPALRDDTLRVIDHPTGGNQTPDTAAARALDRLVIHRRACG